MLIYRKEWPGETGESDPTPSSGVQSRLSRPECKIQRLNGKTSTVQNVFAETPIPKILICLIPYLLVFSYENLNL